LVPLLRITYTGAVPLPANDPFGNARDDIDVEVAERFTNLISGETVGLTAHLRRECFLAHSSTLEPLFPLRFLVRLQVLACPD
jgi:hypothetical protein